MGNSLPHHRFHLEKRYFFKTMVLHDLTFEEPKDAFIDGEYLTYHAKDKHNRLITFTNFPNWQGRRPVVSIPTSIRDELVRSKTQFKVVLLNKLGICPFIVAFSDNIETNLIPSIPETYLNKKYSSVFTIHEPKHGYVAEIGHICSSQFEKITGLDFMDGILLNVYDFNYVIKDDFEHIRSIEVIHDEKDKVGGLNIII